jgi:hypothetical protein
MAVDAVWSELLSGEFPLTGKNTRNFLDFSQILSPEISLSPYV